jgi:hypothetical protein
MVFLADDMAMGVKIPIEKALQKYDFSSAFLRLFKI